jgi:hypothetical protein
VLALRGVERSEAIGGGVLVRTRLDILAYIPMTPDVASCMFYTGIDPFTKQEVYVARHPRDRKLKRALMQFFKPENYFNGTPGAGRGGADRPDRRRL